LAILQKVRFENKPKNGIVEMLYDLAVKNKEVRFEDYLLK